MSVNLNYFNENVKPNYKERSSAVILKKLQRNFHILSKISLGQVHLQFERGMRK